MLSYQTFSVREITEPHLMDVIFQSSALNRKLRVATCQCGPAAEGPSHYEATYAANTSPCGRFKYIKLQVSWRQRVNEGGRSRGEEAPAAHARQALQERACQGGARGDLRALSKLVQQHQRIWPSVVQDIPASCKTSLLKGIWRRAYAPDQAAHRSGTLVSKAHQIG